MTDTAHTLKYANRLLAALREDVASHERILALLAEQEGLIRTPGDERFEAATRALEKEVRRAPQRKARREGAMLARASAFGVSPSALTLTSVAERLGENGEAVRREATRLRERAEEGDVRNRRGATLVRVHRDVTRELIQVVLGPDDGGDVHEGGCLIDAEV